MLAGVAGRGVRGGADPLHPWRPGAGRATVHVNAQNLGSIAFAQSTRWHSIRSGTFHWSLTGGGKTLAQGTATVGDGAYDIVVLESGTKVTLGIYKAEAGRPGSSLVRVIHGAPELGSPELEIDGKLAVSSLAYTKATPYVSLSAGKHTLSAMRPGDKSPLAAATVHLTAGQSYSAVVVGTRGQQVKVVALTDRGAPLTHPATPASLTSPAAGGMVVVRPGDSLWQIARHVMGSAASDEAVSRKVVEIWNLNAGRIGTGDPNLIFPGTRLRLP